MLPEFVKKGCKVMVKKVTELIKRVWDEETIPDEWGKGLVVPLYKGSGRRDDLHKYRGISLQCVLLKIMEGVVKRRLEKWAVSVGWLAEEQGGFRKRRGAPDLVWGVEEIVRRRSKEGKQTVCAFLDVEKA